MERALAADEHQDPDSRPDERARPIDEPHRAASQLELLFDLVFVVAVAQLAHRIADGHALTGLAGFLQVFFAIWWAWMNFTWFASSYDTDDVAYRLLTMVQMAGVLVLAAGVPATAVADYRAVVAGYLVMRIESLTRSWALELAPHRVRVNAVAPGPTESEALLAAGLGEEQISRVKAGEAGGIPLGRRGEPEEIAHSILHLADPATTWVTGQVLAVDGGLALI